MRDERHALERLADDLRRTRAMLLALRDRVAGFAEAYTAAARAELGRRPRLDTLRGRARLLEEVRRDLLLDPAQPLPEPLAELLAELPDDGPSSPHVPLFDAPERASG